MSHAHETNKRSCLIPNEEMVDNSTAQQMKQRRLTSWRSRLMHDICTVNILRPSHDITAAVHAVDSRCHTLLMWPEAAWKV